MDDHYTDETEQLFHRLFERYRPQLTSAVRRMLRRDLDGSVPDVVAETQFNCYRHFQPHLAEKFLPWVLKCGRNSAINQLRRLQTRRSNGEAFPSELEKSEIAEPPSLQTPETELLDKEEVERVRSVIARIPSRAWREAFDLWFWEELPYKEIAGRLGIPIGTVMSRIHRARRFLAENADDLREPEAAPAAALARAA